jgi:Trypsin-like peptidase domain/TIR domain
MSVNTSIVRIRMADGAVVGAGFLVDERHIFTCAHVVTQALGMSEDESETPQEQVWLDFPLVAPKKILTAKLVCWCPKREDESGDIAVLQLQEEPPEGTEAICFAEAEDCWNHPFRAFGFPSEQDDGVWATGQLLGRQATNWIMIEDVKAQGFGVVQGFSGGPVWDTRLEGAVGMVVAASRATDTKTAFVIPLDVLTETWKINSPMLNQRVFLSSAPGDAVFAEKLRDDLSMQGVVVWNEQKGPGGTPASEGEPLQKAIRAAQALVLIVSPQTRASRTVKEHLRLADLYRRRLILVWVGDDPHVKPQRYGWYESTWLDANEAPYPSILETIESSLSQDRLTSITALLGSSDESVYPEPRNPYKGLRGFTADDAKDFFGRDRLSSELVKDVQGLLATDEVTPEQGRLLVLIGASGSGKSSVLMAGLLPKLQYDALPGSAGWIYLEPMVPGKRPIERLALVLKAHFSDSSIKTLREDLDDDAARGLHLLATQLVKKSDTRVVLIVDQFEELFTLTESETERQQFLELLVTACTESRGPIMVILTIRADFYDRPMQYPALNRLMQAHLRQVLPMDIEDLRATIEQPAAQHDVRLSFEGNLVGDLLFEVQGYVGALPLLQFTLEQLFQRRSGHRLTLQAYHELGGVKGALAQHAEKTYTNLSSDEHRRLARALFIRLIEPGTTEQDTTRRRASLTEFVFDDAKLTRVMSDTIDAFVAARLLMTNDIADVKTLEVSHEAVIREWPHLAIWIQDARKDIPLQQAVSEDAEAWVRHGRPTDRLYRGTQLEEAQAWAMHYMTNKSELTFLHASEQQQKRSKLVKVAVIFLLLILIIPAGLLEVPQLTLIAQQLNIVPITVTSLQDNNGSGSLRAAIQAANEKNHIIHFDSNLRGKTIILTNNLILEKSFTLAGPGVTISSGAHDYQISINAGYSIKIEGLAFKQSMFTGNHFIHNYGTLILDNTTISDNRIRGSHINLIYNDRGHVTISHSTISHNAIEGSNTALIYNDRGNLAISYSIISNNIGEIYNTGGPLTITNSIISNMNRNNPDKTSNGSPSAIYNDIGGLLSIRDSTITDNFSYYNGGSIYNGAYLTISGSTISDNSFLSVPGPDTTKNGGGIANDMGATLIIKDSTIAGNTAGHSGGGIANLGGILTITNSTIAGNTAGDSGGGIANLGGGTINLMSFCTIYGNSASAGAGVAVINGSVTMGNSIVAGNTLVPGGKPPHQHIIGMLISKGFNLIQNMTSIVSRHRSIPDTSNIAISRFTPVQDRTVSGGNLTKIFDPQGLQKNGGQAETYKLLPGADDPAIDAIPLAVCNIPDIFDATIHKYIDQRGAVRPDDNEQFCDIGAYESSG